MALEIVFFVLIAFLVIQLFYYLIIFSRFAFSDKESPTQKNIPISVIVCAKNEEQNVQKLIPLLLNQDYPTYEIVLINDASSDNTLEVFEQYQKQYPNIKVVNVVNNETFWGNKKYALTLGIKAARYEYLLFIDADCYPASEAWVSQMSSHFSRTHTLVLGYGAYEKIRNSFLNKIIRFETLFTALQYFSWAKAKHPYMGVGRNMAYKRDEFFKTNGFINHMKIRSGDDDLFVNEASNAQNTTCCHSLESFTFSSPEKNFSQWISQKRRHVTTAKYYKTFDKMQLGVFYVSQLAFVTLSIILLILGYDWKMVLPIIIFRYLTCWTIIGFTAGKLNEKDTIYLYPILEITLIFTQLYLFVSNIFLKPPMWK